MSKFDSEDLPVNPSDNEHFQSIVNRVVSRRGILKAGAGIGALAFLGGALSACGGSSSSGGGTTRPGTPKADLGFRPVSAEGLDERLYRVVVPEGYTADVLAPWGTPLFHGVEYKDDGSNSAEDQAKQVGDNHDGMHFFPIGDGSSEGLLVMNHEYVEPHLFATGQAENADDALKGLHAHGISVIHIMKNGAGKWEIVTGSSYNRRITGMTPMAITGPAAGHPLLATSADPTGTMAFGTLNNCGNGYTLWGTYLTCEENFNQYFGSTSGEDTRNALQRRYGLVGTTTSRLYGWERFHDRFDYVKEPNESNRFGWIVEIDPFDPSSTPKKRTALGRFKHENCAMTLAKDGRVVVYMGDDQAHDYIYKFVSDGKYDPDNPLANRNLLENGKLYVARFEDGEAKDDMMGTGVWILLDKFENETLRNDLEFADQGEVLVKTRLAADAVGATPMDRPEWVAVHPKTGEVYCTLTNNSARTADEVNDANPRAQNRYGQIVRWREADGDAAALAFEWDLFVLAGNPVVYSREDGDLRAGSENVTPENMFNSPDGLAFDAAGRLWIETDGNDSNSGDFAGQGNNQMLAADPETGEIRRFLFGPKGSEVTGITWTPDMKYMFINIQHPGVEPGADVQWPKSQWDYVEGGGARPRSATVVISKDDGGVIGS